MTEANGLPNCGDCIYACEHVNIKGSPCYDCKHRNKFIKAVEQNSSEPDFDKMPIEKINQYLREHGYDPEKVGLRGQILAEALTKNIIAREIIQRLLADPGGCRFCDFGVLRKPDNPLKGHDENCPYLAAHAYLDNETSTVVKRDLSDAEIEELGAQEAERKEFCPNCEAVTPCTHEAELFVCDICGEDFAKYIVSRNCNVSDVSMTRDVSTDIKTPSSIENTNPDYYKQELASRDALIERLVEAGTMVLAYSLPMNETGAKWRMAWQPLVTEWKAMKGGE